MFHVRALTSVGVASSEVGLDHLDHLDALIAVGFARAGRRFPELPAVIDRRRACLGEGRIHG
jgi:hypothetical protein